MITRYAWGTVWTRPGLDPRVRRLLVLAMTASLGRWEEFRLHVRTGLAAELEMVDLKEVLLQVAVYAGVPAANTGFQTAARRKRRSSGCDAAHPIAISARASLGENVRTFGNHRDRGARRQCGRERRRWRTPWSHTTGPTIPRGTRPEAPEHTSCRRCRVVTIASFSNCH